MWCSSTTNSWKSAFIAPGSLSTNFSGFFFLRKNALYRGEFQPYWRNKLLHQSWTSCFSHLFRWDPTIPGKKKSGENHGIIDEKPRINQSCPLKKRRMITSSYNSSRPERSFINKNCWKKNILTFCKTETKQHVLLNRWFPFGTRNWALEGTLSGLHWQQTHFKPQTFGKKHPSGHQFLSMNIMFEQDTLLKLHDLL